MMVPFTQQTVFATLSFDEHGFGGPASEVEQVYPLSSLRWQRHHTQRRNIEIGMP